jgi:hypothetical protein
MGILLDFTGLSRALLTAEHNAAGPVVQATQQTEAEGSLKPKSMEPGWAT